MRKGGIVISNTLEEIWLQYEAGKDYKRRIGLYETVRRNERFYRGDQWQGEGSGELPRPVFNLVRRITDHLVCSTLPGDLSIRYFDEGLPFLESAAKRRSADASRKLLEGHAAWRWKNSHMESCARRALLDAAISGDGVFYCWWDPEERNGQCFGGDVCTELIDSTNLFVADVNRSDLQSQEYVILSGRTSVASLQKEAIAAGASRKEAARILPDNATDGEAGEMASYELRGTPKTTYLLRFHKENGEVIMEKCTRDCMIRRVNTGLHRYPVAYFHWYPVKNSFHGNAPVSDMVANQQYINTAYAMMMKHMSDTAFSKVIYDKSRIPEWSNRVGEAIAALGGGNVSDAVSVVGVGEMQEGYLTLINDVIENTKRMMGATDSALGDEKAENTSAILALQQVSRITLKEVRGEFCRCIEELALIWADMLCVFCSPERMLPCYDGMGQIPDYEALRRTVLRATVEVDDKDAYTPSATVTVLDRLLEGGHLDIRDYLSLLPRGVLADREAILQTITEKGAVKNE